MPHQCLLRLTVQAGYFCACVLVCHEHASLLVLLTSHFGFACLCWPVHGTLCIQLESPKTVNYKLGEACNRVSLIQYWSLSRDGTAHCCVHTNCDFVSQCMQC